MASPTGSSHRLPTPAWGAREWEEREGIRWEGEEGKKVKEKKEVKERRGWVLG